MQSVEQYTRYCPGEEHIRISDAVCYGRRRVSYPKCKGCQFNDDERARQQNRKLLAPGLVVDGPRSQRIEQVFGQLDVLGCCPDPLDEDTAWRMGFATGTFLRGSLHGMDRSDPARHRVVLGRDRRATSPALARAAADGLLASGTSVINVGIIDTPQLYFAVNHLVSCGGLMVTGSSAPHDHNGFRLCGRAAAPIGPDTGLQEIAVIAGNTAPHRPQQPGAVLEDADVGAAYRDFVLRFLEQGRPLKVVIDAVHGVAGRSIPLVFEDVGDIEIEALRFEHDSTVECTPDPGIQDVCIPARREVEAVAADFGVCFDGDADRCVFIDETGRVVPGDVVAALLAEALVGPHDDARVVHDVCCSRVLPETVKRRGATPLRERVGHVYMKKAMNELHALFGAERQGHYYFKDNWGCESGLLALVHLINVLSHTDRTLSELIAPYLKYHSSGEQCFRHDDADAALRELEQRYGEARIDYLDGVTMQFPEWWCNVRKDAPACLLRLNLEANTGELLGQRMAEVAPLLGEPA